MRYLTFLLLVGWTMPLAAQKVDSTISPGQLIGTWQFDSPRMSNAFGKTFRFFKDGTYVLHYSEYDDLNRILSVKGRYKLEARRLFLTIASRVEIVGGKLERGSPGFQSEEFVLDSGEVKVFRQEDTAGSDPFYITVLGTNKYGKISCIKIDNNKYYKLSSDPNLK